MKSDPMLYRGSDMIFTGMTAWGLAAFPMMFLSQLLGVRGVEVVICSAGAGFVAGGITAWRVMSATAATRRRINIFYCVTVRAAVVGLFVAGITTLLWQRVVGEVGVPVVYCASGIFAATRSALYTYRLVR